MYAQYAHNRVSILMPASQRAIMLSLSPEPERKEVVAALISQALYELSTLRIIVAEIG